MFSGDLGMSGELAMKRLPAAPQHKVKRARWADLLKIWLTREFIMGLIGVKLFVPMARLFRFPVMMMYSELSVRVWDGLLGEWTDYGIVSRRVITNAGVTFLRDDWNASATTFADMNYHGIGTGTNAENVTDTALQTESTTALNPNNTRATGTRSTPASNQFRSVGTLTVDADVACTEHGLLSASATGSGTLWDRSVFSVINLVGANPDSIQATYTGTLAAGG